MKVRYQMEELVRTAEYESVKFSIALEEDFAGNAFSQEQAIDILRKTVQSELAKDVRRLKKKRGIE